MKIRNDTETIPWFVVFHFFVFAANGCINTTMQKLTCVRFYEGFTCDPFMDKALMPYLH